MLQTQSRIVVLVYITFTEEEMDKMDKRYSVDYKQKRKKKKKGFAHVVCRLID